MRCSRERDFISADEARDASETDDLKVAEMTWWQRGRWRQCITDDEMPVRQYTWQCRDTRRGLPHLQMAYNTREKEATTKHSIIVICMIDNSNGDLQIS